MFPDFPEFTPLHLELKDPYNELVRDLPPYSDISFATLQIWWNLSEQLSVSILNRNLVIDYHQPFDTANSGLSLIGKNKVDASIQELFHYLREKHQKVQLLHVPQFVVDEIAQPETFVLQEEHDYNEYLLDSAGLAKLEGHEYQRLRKKINRFIREIGEDRLEVKALDLTLTEVQDELFRSIAEWENANTARNDPDHSEHLALRKTLSHAAALDIRNLAVFIDKRLHGIIIYHQPLEKNYYVLHHLKASYEHSLISDYLHHEIAKRAAQNNVSVLNIEMDLGIESLKNHKMMLRPTDFFKKYTIRSI
jgi:hypothetical protein